MALIKKAKNNKDSSDDWCGHTIASGEYYQIPEARWNQWAHDDKVLNDIASDDLIINNGTSDLSTTDEQITHLRAYVEGEKIYNEPANTYGLQMKGVSGTVNINTTTDIDLKLENYSNFPNSGQNESYTYKYLWGGQCFVTNAVAGDYARFQVVDKDNILGYGAGFIAKEYIVKVYIDPNKRMQFESLAPGELNIGLYLRCKYTAVNSGSTRTVYINYDINTKG